MIPTMEDEWRQEVRNTIATLPRRGWRGRWDALLFALGIHKFLRVEETPLTFSVWLQGGEAKITIGGSAVEAGPNNLCQ